MKIGLAAIGAILPAVSLAIGTPAVAHRLDEYLQATTISLEQNHIQAQMRLTSGVAVFPRVFASMDSDGNGVLSEAEQRAYAEKALGDVSLTLDDKRLRLRLAAWKFAKTAEMKAGRGDIQLDFTADAPPGGSNRKLIFENHHQSKVAVYLVNCLVPRDPNIQVTAQKRNYLQSRYELDYIQAGVPSTRPSSSQRPNIGVWLGAVLLLLSAPFAWLWRRGRAGKDSIAPNYSVSADKTASPEGGNV